MPDGITKCLLAMCYHEACVAMKSLLARPSRPFSDDKHTSKLASSLSDTPQTPNFDLTCSTCACAWSTARRAVASCTCGSSRRQTQPLRPLGT